MIYKNGIITWCEKERLSYGDTENGTNTSHINDKHDLHYGNEHRLWHEIFFSLG